MIANMVYSGSRALRLGRLVGLEALVLEPVPSFFACFAEVKDLVVAAEFRSLRRRTDHVLAHPLVFASLTIVRKGSITRLVGMFLASLRIGLVDVVLTQVGHARYAKSRLLWVCVSGLNTGFGRVFKWLD